MGKDLSIEDPEAVFFTTIRTINSRLWFINNPKLHERILAFLARYQEVYGVIIYGFIIMGNHYHLLARFPLANKAAFFRDFNSIIARLTGSLVEQFDGGKLWARSYRAKPQPRTTLLFGRVAEKDLKMELCVSSDGRSSAELRPSKTKKTKTRARIELRAHGCASADAAYARNGI